MTDRRRVSATRHARAGSEAASRVRRADLGLVAAVVTAAAFGTSGPFAKALLTTGWSSGGIVLLRVGDRGAGGGATRRPRLPRTVVRGPGQRAGGSSSSASSPSPAARWPTSTPWARSPSESPCCWSTPETVSLVVLWVWLRTRRAPSRLTLHGGHRGAGGAGPSSWTSRARPARPRRRDVGSAGCRRPGGLLRGLPRTATADCRRSPWPASEWASARSPWAAFGACRGRPARVPDSGRRVSPGRRCPPGGQRWGEWPWSRRRSPTCSAPYAVRALGATLASFVGLSEVLFAILFAWLLLGELAALIQLAGGVRRRGRRGRGPAR